LVCLYVFNFNLRFVKCLPKHVTSHELHKNAMHDVYKFVYQGKFKL
jgi:hypothetical protein